MPTLEFLRSLSFTDLLNTGTWSIFQPQFESSVAPCMDACPASIDMPRLYDLLAKDEVEEACMLLLRYNPFPFVTAAVCPHFCQNACNRGELDNPVEIRKLEGWLGDEVLSRNLLPKPSPSTGKKALVVGSGPAGLSAAWYLALGGVGVTIYEREKIPGGMLAWGIPPFRFPRRLLEETLERLRLIGVTIRTSMEVHPRDLEEAAAGFDCVVVATGLTRARKLPQVESGSRILLGLEVLKTFNLEGETPPGENVLVIGGGNVAVDVARMLRRKGARVTMACVEGRDEMPAIEEEVLQALDEGIELVPSVGLKGAVEEAGQVMVTLARVEVTNHSSPLKEVRFVGPVQRGVFDLIVLAVGQESAYDWKSCGEAEQAGDLVTGPSSVAEAIASGREAARRILSRFSNRKYLHLAEEEWQRDRRDVVVFQDLNPYNLAFLPSTKSFPPGVPREVANCLSCGYCNGCGTCWLFCPDASIRLQQPPVLDADHCKGCGICAVECPRGVIFMRKRT